MPNAHWETIIRTPDAVNVVRDNNLRYDLRHLVGTSDFVLPDRIWSDLVPSIDGLVGSDLASRMWNSRSQSSGGSLERFGINADAVPEPANWVLLMMGFALVNPSLRDKRAGLWHALAQFAFLIRPKSGCAAS